MHRLLDVITGMSEQALSDQGSQGSKKNTWKSLKAGGTDTSKRWGKEEDEVGNVLFYYPQFFGLPLDS